MGKDNKYLQMEIFIKANISMVSLMERGSINGNKEDIMKANSIKG
jgi:hypothetical protein